MPLRRRGLNAVAMASLLATLMAGGCGRQPTSRVAETTGPMPQRRGATGEAGSGSQSTARAELPTPAWPQKVASQHLPNAWRVHSKVISGGLPEGDAAFQELAKLGVKTILSVDGAQPDVALARKYGLRYVHMPHGYDGVPELRAKELAKAVRDLPGTVYIHCHHGKHRSPAAAAVACVGAGLLSPNSALAVLKAAGTSPKYRGLYQSAETAKRFDAALLNELTVDYPETVTVPPIADAMVAIEHAHDNLRMLAADHWKGTKAQPDLDAAHEALLLREHYTELLRTEEVNRYPDGFRSHLAQSEAIARKLESTLDAWKKKGSPSPPPADIASAFTEVTESCASCHTMFRDVPLAEKGRR